MARGVVAAGRGCSTLAAGSAGAGGPNFAGRGPGDEVAVQTALFTEVGCERIMRFAFELARTRARREVSSVSAALMLEHLGLPGQAARLTAAIEAVTAAGVLTRDLGGTATTRDVTKALIDALHP